MQFFMRRLVQHISTIYRNAKFLADPHLEEKVLAKAAHEKLTKQKLGKDSLYFHKYFMVHVVQ